MKKFSISNSKKQWIVILCMLAFSWGQLKAQTIHVAAGTVMSQYDFVNSDGVKSDFLKKGSGTYYRMGAEFKLLDTLQMVGSTTSKSFYFSNHRFLASLLTRLQVETSIESSQFNAVGDAIGVAFNYQTNYLGLSTGLSYQQPIIKGWALKATGKVQGIKIVQGNQELQGTYKDLTLDPNFNKFQVALGWELALSKQVNPGLISFVSFSKSNTMNAESAGSTSLNFKNTMFSIGLRFITNKN